MGRTRTCYIEVSRGPNGICYFGVPLGIVGVGCLAIALLDFRVLNEFLMFGRYRGWFGFVGCLELLRPYWRRICVLMSCARGLGWFALSLCSFVSDAFASLVVMATDELARSSQGDSRGDKRPLRQYHHPWDTALSHVLDLVSGRGLFDEKNLEEGWRYISQPTQILAWRSECSLVLLLLHLLRSVCRGRGSLWRRHLSLGSMRVHCCGSPPR